ncbi:MAG: UvrB/UvrC motif-containing protein [Oscillospiraceae bacterium]|nr:UvrB/UvrC motif-containing protein [Oscillospiraceae bacterium]
MYDSFFNIFNDFDDLFNMGTIGKNYYGSAKRCPVCGKSYFEFEKSGKLGCDGCYDTFRDELRVLLRQIHSNSTHRGKIPAESAGEIKKKRYYEDLKKQLAKAVRDEDYEKAAKLHKEIKSIESDNR